MKLLTVDTIEEVRQKLLDCTKSWQLPTENVALSKAHSKILAEDIHAHEDIPSFRRSTVDGYALISTNTDGAGESLPVFLRLIGTVEMGVPADCTVHDGQCVYVPTGAMVPDGADAVVMVEYAEQFDTEIAVYQSAPNGSNIVQKGEDMRKGQVLVRRGTKLRAQEIGALAALGITGIPVFAPLAMTILSSGDELVPPEAAPTGCQVRDTNTSALSALAAHSGYTVVQTLCIQDDEAQLEAAVKTALYSSNIVVLSGGSSQGAKDMTADVFSRIASPGVFTHGLALKPGKPAIFGYDHAHTAILAGLPGHPVSALVVFTAVLSWLMRRLTGQPEPYPVLAALNCNLAGAPGRTTVQPVKLLPAPSGFTAEPIFGKAAAISALTASDGYIVIDINKEGLVKGESVAVFLWE